MLFKASLVSIPEDAITPGLNLDVILKPSSKVPYKSYICFVIITPSLVFTPSESGVDFILPSPTTIQVSLFLICSFFNMALNSFINISFTLL